MLGNRVKDAPPPAASATTPATEAAPPAASRPEGQWQLLVAAGAVVALLVAGFAWVYVSQSGGGGGTLDVTSLDGGTTASTTPVATPTTVDPTAAAPADQQAAAALVAAVRNDNQSRYGDPAAATAAGYRSATALSLRSARFGAVRYFVDPAQVDAAVDPNRPSGLMYRRTADGEQLVGVMFLGIAGQHLAHPAGALSVWYPTALRTKDGRAVEALPVWFGPGVTHPFALTWDGATAA
jgi:hypothetical protein